MYSLKEYYLYVARILSGKLNRIKVFYYDKKLSMREIAERLDVSIDAVVYFMRKNKLSRRSSSETNAIVFKNKKLSFRENTKLSPSEKKLKLIGLMLYWSEGYKSAKSSGIDFANSDEDMIALFIKFLRIIYRINERRLRILLYCYADQNIKSLIKFWSNLTGISKKQFTKPYIRKDFKNEGRKMKHGMVHIRYADKKLFLSIMKSIEEVKFKMRRSDSGYSSGL